METRIHQVAWGDCGAALALSKVGLDKVRAATLGANVDYGSRRLVLTTGPKAYVVR
ncbi:hypothetical protein DPMN_011998 [Dreissena polymorpha]|uniref:Uncharacterized protein n=1 Tax=Dreissena polymorpha TaxID=45954 RepID=A0A9D4N4Q2_DREPO|nr:hypothetical protein DPMN_011998 [Dreissena polymorpha]